MRKRVVITGLGPITPIGIGIDAFRKALRNGQSGAGPITRFPREGFNTKEACEIKNFVPLQGTQLLDPFIQYAVAGVAEAQRSAGFDTSKVDPFRVGIFVSSSKGGMHSFNAFFDRFTKNPSAILAARVYANLVPNFACQWIARKWKLQGPAVCYSAACATGTISIMEAAQKIQDGMVDYAFAGASDASIVPLMMGGYERMGVLSPEGIYPFDRRRRGFLVGEGAGVVFLETLASAKARGAKIYAEIVGSAYGSDSSNAFSFSPQEGALARTLRNLLKKANLLSEKIDYLNLHGTGTREGDVYETGQIKQVFGKKAHQISTSSTKSMVGHMLGAAGAVGVIASCIAMEDNFVPPTINLEKEDPRCDLDYTPRKAREKKINCAISISMGFGGHIAVIALRKV